MSLLTDIIKAITDNKSKIFVKLKSLGVPVSNNVVSVVDKSFATSKTDQSFKEWVSVLIVNAIRNKSSADGSDPLMDSVLFILGGDQDEDGLKAQALKNDRHSKIAVCFVIITITICLWLHLKK